MILYPNAKINIGLNVTRKRNDGYHDLETIMYPIGLCDVLSININESKSGVLNFTTSGIKIDGNINDNLIVKAYELINEKYTLPALDINLRKLIPFGAGLGGGSADCAFTITGINELCQLHMNIAEMEEIAAKLGSDCSFFIQNKPSIAKGRGEILDIINLDLDKYFIVIIIPPIPISTKLAYSKVVPQMQSVKLENSILNEMTEWKNSIKNDFEVSVFIEFPEIKSIKDELYALGADYAALSGSGSAVFGIYREKPDLRNIFPNNYFVWSR